MATATRSPPPRWRRPAGSSHTYADGPNSYTISVELIDEDGTFANDTTLAVTVLNVAPVVTLSGLDPVNESVAAGQLRLPVTDPGADGFTVTEGDIDCGTGGGWWPAA